MAGKVDVGTLTAHIGLDTKGLSKGAAEAKQEISGLARSLTSIAGPLAAAAAGFGVFELFKDFTRTGMEFAHTMETVGGVFRSTAEELERVKEAALSFSESSSFTAQQIGRGFYYLASAGFTATQAIEAMPTVLNLAKIGEMDIARATDVAVNAMRGMGLGVEDLSRAADTMVGTFTRMNSTLDTLAESYTYVVPVGKAFGYTFEELNAMLGVLSNSGVKGSMAGTQLAMAIQRANEVAIKLKFSSGDLIDVLAEMGKQGYTNADIMDMFGQRAGRAALILSQQTTEARRLADTLQTVGGEAEVLSKKMSDTAKSSLGRLKGLWASVGDAVYATYEKQLVATMEGTWSWIDRNRAAIASFLSSLLGLMTDLIGVFSAIGGAVADVATRIAQAFGGVPALMQEIRQEGEATAASFAREFKVPDMTSWDRALETFNTFAVNLGQIFLHVVSTIGSMVAGILNLVGGMVWDILVTLEAFTNALIQAAKIPVAMAKGQGKEQLAITNAAFAEAGQKSGKIFDDMAEAGQRAFDSIARSSKEMYAGLELRSPDEIWAFKHGSPKLRQFLDLSRLEAESFFSDLMDENASATEQMAKDEVGLREYKLELWNNYQVRRKEMLDEEVSISRAKFGATAKDAETLTRAFDKQIAEQRKLFFGGTSYAKPTILPKYGEGSEEAEEKRKTARERFVKEELTTLEGLLEADTTTADQLADVWAAYYEKQIAAIEAWRAEFVKAGGDKMIADAEAQSRTAELFAKKPAGLTAGREHPLSAAFEARAAQDAAAFQASYDRIEAEKARTEKTKELQKTVDEGWVSVADEGFASLSDITTGFFLTEKGKWASFHDSILSIMGDFLSSLLRQAAGAASAGESGGASIGGSIVNWFKGLGGEGAGEAGGMAKAPIVDYTAGPIEFVAQRGGVVRRPSFGLVGEGGPEAIIPLSRFADPSFLSRLTHGGSGGGRGASVTQYIQTPDPQAFRASGSQIAARMALAVRQAWRNL